MHKVPFYTDQRYTVCLEFQDLKTGFFQTVYPQGMTADEVMALLADPAKQFAPVPPPPAPPPYPAT
jgi:hypothetical protein